VALIDIIEDYSPPNESYGVPLKSTIEIQFSTLVDQRSVRSAFFLEGPDSDEVLGPDSRASIWPTASTFGTLTAQNEDFLSSPGYAGIVKGQFSFDLTGGKTKMIFAPDQVLAAQTLYRALLSDVYPESIGTTSAATGNTGSGSLSMTGPWLGANDIIGIRITKAGVAGVAEFIWWKDSDPMELKGPVISTRNSELLLTSGLYVIFGDGEFEIDDEFSTSVTRVVAHEGVVTFTFTSGSGSIEALPSSGSSSVLSSLRQPNAELSSLRVIKTTPTDHSAGNNTNLREIVIEFNKELSSSAISESDIQVIVDAASRHPSLSFLERREIAKRIVVQGRFLKIQI
jgi:hypothetical protein